VEQGRRRPYGWRSSGWTAARGGTRVRHQLGEVGSGSVSAQGGCGSAVGSSMGRTTRKGRAQAALGC
jgi:hypothetical protein